MKKYNVVFMAVAVFAAIAMGSCIAEHEVLPLINKGLILELEVEEQQKAKTIIDRASRTVTIPLYDTVDLEHLKIRKLSVANFSDISDTLDLDLKTPRKSVVSTLSGASAEWTITHRPVMAYVFEIEGQMGETYFDLNARNIMAYVPEEGGTINNIRIKAMKLAPAGSGATMTIAGTQTPIIAGDNAEWDFSRSGLKGKIEIEVKYGSVTETWTLHISESNVRFERADPFARRIFVSALGLEGAENGFEYRIAGGDEWSSVPSEAIEIGINGGFSTYVKGLEPETDYEVRAISNGEESDVMEVTTLGVRPLLGGRFEHWHKDVVENPWGIGAQWEAPTEDARWWDSGNKGAQVGIDKASNTTQTAVGEGYQGGVAARLESIFVLEDMPAGGNIYFGKFAGVSNGTNGRCAIGHNWYPHKPTGLKGWFKYAPQRINMASQTHVDIHPHGLTRDQWIGSPDSLHICVALWANPDGAADKNDPKNYYEGVFVGDSFTVDTDPSAFVDFARNDPGTLAYGSFISAEPQSEWAEFNIEMDYFQTGELPEHTILYILLTASKSCNYFIAGAKTAATPQGSILWVDELELLYE